MMGSPGVPIDPSSSFFYGQNNGKNSTSPSNTQSPSNNFSTFASLASGMLNKVGMGKTYHVSKRSQVTHSLAQTKTDIALSTLSDLGIGPVMEDAVIMVREWLGKQILTFVPRLQDSISEFDKFIVKTEDDGYVKEVLQQPIGTYNSIQDILLKIRGGKQYGKKERVWESSNVN
eukprot:TRINITY_DN5136_c0_g1_i10.p2 TRINITY_DN5136_c0_g1~~TRINITY_DN5136_c0_g1_i10.p2  ORF type:complete len:174 (-),score=52.78 TRINITY_DN5136_c0_g1_i10:113-634(-)